MNFLALAAAWGVLLIVTIGIGLYRSRLAAQEDDTLHVLDGEEQYLEQQKILSQKLDRLDRWVKILVIVLIVSGIAIGAAYVYYTFLTSDQIRVG